ncbi:phage tail protein [Hyphomonas johnsonii]|nr:tail fiber protein [Hyphomonas johnsonii]
MTRMIAAAGLATSMAMLAQPAQAQEKMMGEIFMTGANFCPRGSLNADGRLLPISEYSAMFSLFGTMYGGDGRTTFALPDLRGRVPVNAGHGPGLSPRSMGQRVGSESHTLTTAQMPAHTHMLDGSATDGDAAESPEGDVFVVESRDADAEGTGTVPSAAVATGKTGGSQAFSKLNPSLAINFCVAMYGTYPSRD